MKALIVAAALAIAAAAQAQTDDPAEATAPDQVPAAPAQDDAAGARGPNNDPNQIVCKVEQEIGSRVSRRRVCRTRAEWLAAQREVRDRTERAQQQTQTQY